MTSYRIAAATLLALAALSCIGGCAAPERARAAAVDGARPEAQPAEVRSERFELAAPDVAAAPLQVEVLLAPQYRDAGRRFPVLYVNDGQDAQAVALREALSALASEPDADVPIVVAIAMPPDRMAAYGLSDRAAARSVVGDTKYGAVGAKAQAYSHWVAQVLVPHVDAHYRTRAEARDRAMLGWSLGALNAFDLGWQYPEVFGTVGAFSPSFWVPARRDAVQATRLAQRIVGAGPKREGLRMFVAVGTDEESDDRDSDGVNDAIDDARDLLDGGDRGRGLKQLGYTVDLDWTRQPSRQADVDFALVEGGRHDQASWKRVLPEFLRWAYGTAPLAAPSPLATRPADQGVTGTLRTLPELASRHSLPRTRSGVAPRRIDVWLPPGYETDADRRYPVLYMHDGQNLFDPKTSYGGVDWGVDEAMTRLIAAGAVRPAIVVGIWNSPQRFAEYMPQKAVTRDQVSTGVDAFPPIARDTLLGDAYLRYLVEEVKPTIDREFRTRPGREDTFVMGSSMGALISLYAIAEYPQVFGGAAAVSTHWPAGDGVVVDWFGAHLPDPRTHRLYFDHGTATLDAGYAPYQQRMDALLRTHGWQEGAHWTSHVYPGAEHNEQAWRSRVEVPLRFLLRP
jgi:predicted alpha/beta superfamily hydrolase